MTRRLLAATLMALLGSSLACSKPDSPTAPTTPPPAADGPIFYTAIGASDGIGFGSSSPCVPFTDCPDGKGYVQILRRQLREAFPNRTVEHRNLSIPGAVLSPAIESLARDIGQPISELAGNFIERQAPFVPANTTHVTIFAGGNDANVIARAAVAGRGGSDVNAYVDQQVLRWGSDLEDLVARIRSRAPNARIVALNMINLAAAPYVASRPTSEKSILQRIAVGLSDRVNALTSRNVLVADLMCDARLYQAASYASDGFHPGDIGYQVFAELTLRPLRDGTATAPNTSCAQRRIFP
ncbi:MAG TPA: GDSL-type esterase/lipase family protein [Vicinamibacterales bacterium]|nr:GDSL-type esterase/lipase family protein [Vicinamibacterales bacterium]